MHAATSNALAIRPSADEFAPYYARYIDRVPDGDLLVTLESQLEATVALLDTFGESNAGIRYAPGKWSVKQVVGHLNDAERIFTYRAVCAARGERASLPGFDENTYVDEGGFDGRTLNSLMGEMTAVRRATLSLVRNLDDAQVARTVVANGVPVSVRALAWIIAGHEVHHAELFRERYAPLIK
jgi:uncharacterized damage-inducible protein DinB